MTRKEIEELILTQGKCTSLVHRLGFAIYCYLLLRNFAIIFVNFI